MSEVAKRVKAIRIRKDAFSSLARVVLLKNLKLITL